MAQTTDELEAEVREAVERRVTKTKEPGDPPKMSVAQRAADEVQILVHRLSSGARALITEQIDALQQQLRAYDAQEQLIIEAVKHFALCAEETQKVHGITMPKFSEHTAQIEKGNKTPLVITGQKTNGSAA